MNEWDEQATCHIIGINGGCGLDCPVLIRGDCDVEYEIYGNLETPPENEFADFDRAMEILK